MMRAVILPGMDGTGRFLGDFVAAIAPAIEATVVRYPLDRVLGYEALADIAGEAIPDGEPFVLVAESFSGPIAVRLAARRPRSLIGMVFCASFASTPRVPALPLPASALRRIARALPLRHLPSSPVAALMMGRWSTPSWRTTIATVLRTIQPAVLRARLLDVLRVDDLALLRGFDRPVLYLRARQDLLVSGHSGNAIKAVAAQTTIVEFDAPHFILQAATAGCAQAVLGWCGSIGGGNIGNT